MKIYMTLIDTLIAYIEKYEKELKKIKEISENTSNLSEEDNKEIAINVSDAATSGICLTILTGVFLKSYFTNEEIKEFYELVKELSSNALADGV